MGRNSVSDARKSGTPLMLNALEENAVNLVYAFIGLQNSYELNDFSTKRQGIVTALVACCPKKSAPCVHHIVTVVIHETNWFLQLYH